MSIDAFSTRKRLRRFIQPAQYSELRTITESAAAAIAADLESRDGQGKTQTNAIPGSVSRGIDIHSGSHSAQKAALSLGICAANCAQKTGFELKTFVGAFVESPRKGIRTMTRKCNIQSRAGKGVVLFTRGFRAAVAAIHGK